MVCRSREEPVGAALGSMSTPPLRHLDHGRTTGTSMIPLAWVASVVQPAWTIRARVADALSQFSSTLLCVGMMDRQLHSQVRMQKNTLLHICAESVSFFFFKNGAMCLTRSILTFPFQSGCLFPPADCAMCFYIHSNALCYPLILFNALRVPQCDDDLLVQV